MRQYSFEKLSIWPEIRELKKNLLALLPMDLLYCLWFFTDHQLHITHHGELAPFGSFSILNSQFSIQIPPAGQLFIIHCSLFIDIASHH
jgi:hypothetical protein